MNIFLPSEMGRARKSFGTSGLKNRGKCTKMAYFSQSDGEAAQRPSIT